MRRRSRLAGDRENELEAVASLLAIIDSDLPSVGLDCELTEVEPET